MKLFAAVVVSAVLGATLATVPVRAATSLSAADQQFVDQALKLNDTALHRAQIVTSSADNYVLDYAEAILGDRQAANRELASIAQSADYHSTLTVTPETGAAPTVRPSGSNAHANEQKLNGNMAPVPYFQEEVKANQAAVALYQKESAIAGSSALRAYAKKYLTKLQGELSQASHLLHVEMGLHPSHR
jgi:hypothetical protein